MENRGSKAMALAALIVGVVGLTIGFAAFSATLNINSVTATYNPNESQFVSVFGFDTTVSSGTVAQKYAKTWSGLNATFDAPGQTVELTATILNGSNYAANLDNTPAIAVTSCEAANPAETNADLVTAACNEIRAAVTDGRTKVEAPATVAKKTGAVEGNGTVTVTIVGPTTAVDGVLNVEFSDITLDYTTLE